MAKNYHQQAHMRTNKHSRKIDCPHDKVTPTVPDSALAGMSAAEIRKRFPRFDGKCPDCGAKLIAYASTMHYIAGDW